MDGETVCVSRVLGRLWRKEIYPQNFPLMLIEYVCSETSMRFEHLSGHGAAKSVLLLSQVANVVPLSIHDDVSVCLLEAHEYVHHLQLSLNNNG